MRPCLLDLMCGAGGCTEGYKRAGFYVVGVDINSQPNYCGDEFVQMDALDAIFSKRFWGRVDAYHASPPCQFAAPTTSISGCRADHPNLIPPIREQLLATGLPYVIENVERARPHLRAPIRLCGSSFGLGVWRHRLFEMSYPPTLVPPCSHALHPYPLDVTGTGGESSKPRMAGGGLSRKPANLAKAREAMGIDWMTRAELAEAIPPAYTEFIGAQLLNAVRVQAAA